MGCISSFAVDGKCCLCYDKVADGQLGLTVIETRSGEHYVCQDCKENAEQKYESGDIDIFEVKREPVV